MKNIEGVNTKNTLKISPKLEKIIQQTNLYLQDKTDIKEILLHMNKIFTTLKRLAQLKVHNLKNEKEFEELLFGIQEILKKLDIEKLYNSTNIGNLEEFNNLNLLSQFFFISIPKNTKANFNLSKGGVCYHWSLFFYNFFKEVDPNNKIEKKIIFLDKKFKHSVLYVKFKNTAYLIDPYSKSNGLLTKVEKGNKVYLGAQNNELLFGEIVNENPLEINFGNYKLKLKTYTNPKNFIKQMRKQADLLNIKTFVNGKSYHLMIKGLDNQLFINFNGNQFLRDKDIAITELVGLYLDKLDNNKPITNYQKLLALLGAANPSNEIKTGLKAISEKINWNYVFENLGIGEEIKMFLD